MPDDREPEVLSAPREADSDTAAAAEDAAASDAEVEATSGADDSSSAQAELARSGPTGPTAAKKRVLEPAITKPLTPARPLRKKTSAPTFQVAGFWRRMGAGLVDMAIVLPVAYLLCWIAGAAAGISLPQTRHRGLDFWLDLFLANDPALIGALGLTLAIAAIYAMVFQITTAATPGMKLLKTRIIDLYGDQPSTVRSLARTGGYLLGVATLALGFLWIGFDSEKRGLHDWISGTYVVKI